MYGKMLITVVITLYTTRLVLNALGVVDFGIYNLVAGLVAMLSFLNAAMTTSTQRFLSFYYGKGCFEKQKIIFSNSLLLHLLLAIILIIFIECIGLFLFDGFLNIPSTRISVAKNIYHFMAISVGLSVISVPFVASINAHENMFWIAFVNIIEVLLKLIVALLLYNGIIHIDNLIFYSLTTVLIGGISFILYSVFCLKRYKECSLKGLNKVDKVQILELSSFAGWNLFGALCGVGRTQGIAVVLNVFLGATLNAAYGIANQIVAQLNFFSVTMLRAINPQIMKSEGMDNRKRMIKLATMASKFGYLLLAIIAIPAIFEMETILRLWLQKVPNNTVIFCRLILVGSMIGQLTVGLQSAIQATGKVRIYQVVVGSLILLNIPFAILLLKLGFPAYSVLISYVFIEILACITRVLFVKMQINMSIKFYISRVFVRILFPTIVSIFFSASCFYFIHLENFRFIVTFMISSIAFLACTYCLGLENEEKIYIKNLFKKN